MSHSMRSRTVSAWQGPSTMCTDFCQNIYMPDCLCTGEAGQRMQNSILWGLDTVSLSLPSMKQILPYEIWVSFLMKWGNYHSTSAVLGQNHLKSWGYWLRAWALKPSRHISSSYQASISPWTTSLDLNIHICFITIIVSGSWYCWNAQYSAWHIDMSFQ